VKRPAVLAAIVLAAGCASLQDQYPSPQARECAEWYQALDEATDAAGVRDAQYTRVAGFPYLRVDRMLASLRGRAAASEPALHAFAERLLELDLESRRYEIDNLPRGQVDALPQMRSELPRASALRRTYECGRLLRKIDMAKPQLRAAMLSAAEVPDDYSGASRVLGLYAVTRIPFARGVRQWEGETLAAFGREAEGLRVRYAPPAAAPLQRAAVAAMVDRTHFDPLGQPTLSPREFERLVSAYAPSFDVELAGDYDRFGLLRWRRDAALPEVDPAEAAVYVQPAYTRYGESVLLQLVYTIWFPERPPRSELDLLAGKLDGLIWRVTLAPDGAPLLYDSIHPCGCYHLFFPTPRARPLPAPDPLEEWAFVPQTLPPVGEGERPVVRIASATHYIEGVSLVRGSDSVARYVLHPYDELRSMQRVGESARSAFGPDGIIAGSERAERFLFWPMGIASPGAMRQWGRHATAFVGRRHFDDADLLERRFQLDLEGPGR
jgi:hypothetical protein